MILQIFLLLLFIILILTYLKTRKIINRNYIEANIYKELNSLYSDYVLLVYNNKFDNYPTIKKLIEKDIEFLKKIDKNLDLRNVFVGRLPTKKKEKSELLKLETEIKKSDLEIKKLLFNSININFEIMKVKNKKLYKTLQYEIQNEKYEAFIKELSNKFLKNFIKKNKQYIDNFNHEKKIENILEKFNCCQEC